MCYIDHTNNNFGSIDKLNIYLKKNNFWLNGPWYEIYAYLGHLSFTNLIIAFLFYLIDILAFKTLKDFQMKFQIYLKIASK